MTQTIKCYRYDFFVCQTIGMLHIYTTEFQRLLNMVLIDFIGHLPLICGEGAALPKKRPVAEAGAVQLRGPFQ